MFEYVSERLKYLFYRAGAQHVFGQVGADGGCDYDLFVGFKSVEKKGLACLTSVSPPYVAVFEGKAHR